MVIKHANSSELDSMKADKALNVSETGETRLANGSYEPVEISH